jgi:hypothetical protein
MAQVEFELTITACERAKTVHVLDGAATVIGDTMITLGIKFKGFRFESKPEYEVNEGTAS